MAWTTPTSWPHGGTWTRKTLEDQLTGNLTALSVHKHSGATGDGGGIGTSPLRFAVFGAFTAGPVDY